MYYTLLNLRLSNTPFHELTVRSTQKGVGRREVRAPGRSWKEQRDGPRGPPKTNPSSMKMRKPKWPWPQVNRPPPLTLSPLWKQTILPFKSQLLQCEEGNSSSMWGKQFKIFTTQMPPKEPDVTDLICSAAWQLHMWLSGGNVVKKWWPFSASPAC